MFMYVEMQSRYSPKCTILGKCVADTPCLSLNMFGQSKDIKNIDSDRPKVTLRSNSKIKLKKRFSTLKKVHKSPYYRGIKAWEKLPHDIQTVEVKSEFKKKLSYKFNVKIVVYN